MLPLGEKTEDIKVKRKALSIAFLLTSVLVLPFVIRAQDKLVDAGPDQTVYVGQNVNFNGSVLVDPSFIGSIEWNFGDGSSPINGSDPTLLKTTTHVYTTEAVYNATLSVKFGADLNRTETDTVAITVLQNLPPVADAGPDQIVEQTSALGSEVTLNGTGSSDPYDDLLTYYWNWIGGSATGVTPTALFPPGNTTVTLTVSDGQFNSTDKVNIIVQDTTPPVVDAGPDITVEQESHAGTEVNLNGTATDAVSTRFNFTWSENGIVLGTEQNLTYTFNLGTHIVTLNATDMAGNTGSDNVTVKVIDTTPPQIDVTVTPSTLWPPNHKYVEVTVTVTAYDICDPSPSITFVSITSNEPDNGIGDGSTVNDIVVINDFTFTLRAERSGTGSGRTYTITYQVADASGNVASASVTVEVPHNQ